MFIARRWLGFAYTLRVSYTLSPIGCRHQAVANTLLPTGCRIHHMGAPERRTAAAAHQSYHHEFMSIGRLIKTKAYNI